MTITLNGEARQLPDQCTIAELLKELQLDPRFLAVERNLSVVPRTEHAACQLCDGDSLEIVTLVGGG